MTNAQRSGRLLLALATGFLVAPFLAYFLVCLAWLSFRFGALLCIIGLMWLLCRVWEGKRWAVRLAAGLAAIVGIVGAVRGVVQSRALPGPVVGLFCVFGPIFVGVAWFLTFSPPVREYLKMLRLRREKKVQDR